MNMNAGGQTIADRINAARFGLAGHMLAKAVCKATTEEQIGPKKKHLDYLLHCTEEPNVSIPQLANLLLDRLQHNNWVVVYKALVSVHHLMLYGNERFIQYLASANTSFSLNSFLDNKSGVQGYDMSTYIRRYSKYLNQKALSYRVVAFDFCKVKRGKDDGVLRKMPAEKLLKTLPVIQDQMDALLEFDCSPNELTNAVISSCFVLLFRDLIRLFACYNDGIINMLEKYFDMNKKCCKDALEIYKKFLVRMDKVASFLKVAENVGIPKGEIPDLTKAPASLLDALEQHLDSLEGGKRSAGTPPGGVSGSGSFHTGLMSLSATEHSLNEVDEKERQRALQEEQMAMEELRKKREQQAAMQQAAPEAGASFTNFPKAPSAATSPTNGVASHHNSVTVQQTTTNSSSRNDLFDSLLDLDFNAGGGFGGGVTQHQQQHQASTTANYGALSSFSMSDGFGNPQQQQQPARTALPPQALFNNNPSSTNPFASPTAAYPQQQPGGGSMQSPGSAMMNPFGAAANGYQSSNMTMAFNSAQQSSQPKMFSPMGQQPQGASGFDANFDSVFGSSHSQQNFNAAPFGATPTKTVQSNQSAAQQSKLIQNNVEQSLANIANNLNLGSLGAYGVRPQAAPGSGQMANPGFSMGGSMPRQPMAAPMNPVNNFGGQPGQYGGANPGGGAWNPFAATAGPQQQQGSPVRTPQTATANDPFASLI